MDAGKKKINDILNGNRQLVIPFFSVHTSGIKIYGNVSLKVWNKSHRLVRNIFLDL